MGLKNQHLDFQQIACQNFPPSNSTQTLRIIQSRAFGQMSANICLNLSPLRSDCKLAPRRVCVCGPGYPIDPFTTSELQTPPPDFSELQKMADLLILSLENCESVGRDV